jgi:hypothetical protein
LGGDKITMVDMTEIAIGSRVRVVAARCERLGMLISEEASRTERTDRRLRLINIVIGAIAALVTISGPVSAWLGANATQAISVIAAVVLIFDGLIPYFRGTASADRLREYAFYIHHYVGMIEGTDSDQSLTSAQRESKINSLLHLAELNLSDVCSKFPTLYHRAIVEEALIASPTKLAVAAQPGSQQDAAR